MTWDNHGLGQQCMLARDAKSGFRRLIDLARRRSSSKGWLQGAYDLKLVDLGKQAFQPDTPRVRLEA
jgi:hypothetical protein